MRLTMSAAVTSLVASQAAAGEVTIRIEIPRLAVAEYHRPYVAFWIQGAGGEKASSLAVWYDTRLKDSEGNKWLKDLRQWWRRTGRELTLPADGLSSPTRPPGTHELRFDATAKPFADLPAGDYQLVVEAAREVGGRELVRLPFHWPPQAPQALDRKGEHEVGTISLALQP